MGRIIGDAFSEPCAGMQSSRTGCADGMRPNRSWRPPERWYFPQRPPWPIRHPTVTLATSAMLCRAHAQSRLRADRRCAAPKTLRRTEPKRRVPSACVSVVPSRRCRSKHSSREVTAATPVPHFLHAAISDPSWNRKRRMHHSACAHCGADRSISISSTPPRCDESCCRQPGRAVQATSRASI